MATASAAETLAASRTAASAHSVLRLWAAARSLILAAFELLILSANVSGSSAPPLPTTDAAPMVVDGAMAATSPARVMKVAALPACAPSGVT